MSSQQRRFTRIPRAVGPDRSSRGHRARCCRLLLPEVTPPRTPATDSPPSNRTRTAPITIWVDADRAKIAEAFKADNPDLKVNIETYDGNSGGTNSFQTKIALADAAGEGWPDVVWSGQVNDASWAAKEQNGVQAFAAPLNLGVTEDGWLDGYTAGALDPVTVDGNVYGARDNLAPVVFWYNKALFDEFGYDIPETWEDYEALSDKLAAEHPGIHPRLDR